MVFIDFNVEAASSGCTFISNFFRSPGSTLILHFTHARGMGGSAQGYDPDALLRLNFLQNGLAALSLDQHNCIGSFEVGVKIGYPLKSHINLPFPNLHIGI